jgi:tankyrase
MSELTLTEACQQGDLERVRFLIDIRKEPIEQTGVYGPTPLLLACQSGNCELVELLLDRGMNINRVMVQEPTGSFTNLEIHDMGFFDGVSPLFVACERGNSDLVSLLIRRGADVNLSRTSDRMTPLSRCFTVSEPGKTDVRTEDANQRLEIAHMLLRAGADSEKQEGPGSVANDSLFDACEIGHADVVKLLLAYGASVDHPSRYESLLRVACCTKNPGSLSVVNMLIEKGVDINGCEENGLLFPLASACVLGNLPVIKRLLRAGSRAKPLTPRALSDEETPLSYSVSRGNIEAVSTLLAYGACPDRLSERVVCNTSILDSWETYPGEEFVPPPDLAERQARCLELIRRWPDLRNQISVKLCIDRLKRYGYDKVVKRTPTRELPQHLFVFKVIEMMKMCGMEPLAEELIEYIGR